MEVPITSVEVGTRNFSPTLFSSKYQTVESSLSGQGRHSGNELTLAKLTLGFGFGSGACQIKYFTVRN
jgi:hypothetical protein